MKNLEVTRTLRDVECNFCRNRELKSVRVIESNNKACRTVVRICDTCVNDFCEQLYGTRENPDE